MEVIKLLNSKIRCLRKILNLSESFLAQAKSEDFSQLDSFNKYRDSSFKALGLYDRKISDVISKLSPSEKTPHLISFAKTALEQEEILKNQILTTDQEIMSRIELEQMRLTKEISTSDRNNQLVKKFKSTWVSESGETLDGTI